MDLKNGIFWNIFADTWNYFKTFYPPQNNDKYWDKAVAEIENLIIKYKGSESEKLMQDLLLAVLTELERLYRINEEGKTK